ncbi:MAG: argininosuccinate lyase [Bacteroidetes bacterium]|nr:argininosuccinate lyase [Bacteroidota bacterium]
MKLWEKGGSTDNRVQQFTIGRDPSFDLQLAEYDALASLAHARMLHECGLLTVEEWSAIALGLQAIHASITDGTFVIEEGVEDVHSQIELQLIRQVGEAGKQIHTARSRNDQVLVDLKLFLRDRIRDIVEATAAFAEALLERSDRHADVMIPGYTHGQAAMPSSFGQWFAAHAESLTEDLIPLYAAYRIADRNPLGSAAGYGTAFPIDRDRTTELLGFGALHVNAIDAQLSRGKSERIAAQAFASVAASLARFATDVCMYASGNYGFVRLKEEITTGSSIMPHKRNPDVFELIRARCNRMQAVPNDIALMMANLPSGYHRDLQIIKELLFPAIDDLHACMDIALYALDFLEVREGILDDPRYRDVFSVDAIQQRVRDGVSFRDAYREIAAQLKDGTFERPAALISTHQGSPGNLCNDRIRAMLAEEHSRFPFERRDDAYCALLATTAR